MNILLRTRSVATDLVRSQNLQPIRCAFMLCQFGRFAVSTSTWPPESFSSVARTAESSATSGFVAVPEHSLQMKNQPVLTRNALGKSLVSFRKWIKLMQ